MIISPPHVIVAGAGWAGLACALELAWGGARVTLLESARQAGGRARGVAFGDLAVDNGQHLLVGAYRELLRLTARLGLSESELYLRRPLDLRIAGPEGELAMRAAALPAPLHLLVGLIRARGLTAAEKLAVARLTLRLHRSRFGLKRDCSVTELLRRDRQPPSLCQRYWEPLCLAALNTPAATASATLFLRVLKDTFTAGRADSDLLLPRRTLSEAFPDPALAELRRQGAEVRLGCRLTGFTADEGGITAQTEAGPITADRLVLATPPAVTRRLLDGEAGFAAVEGRLDRLREDAPIATVYLQYPRAVGFGGEMLGLIGTLSQWLFDRGAVCGQGGLMAVVMSGEGEHMSLPKAELEVRVAAELAVRFPHWPAPLAAFTVRERRATFHCEVGVDAHRPGCRTTHPRLFLAGDYTATGYPATLEGALRSGVECARLILPPPG